MENIWFYTCHIILYMSQKLVYVDVWFIDLALTVKELFYVMPLTGCMLFSFACGLAYKVE